MPAISQPSRSSSEHFAAALLLLAQAAMVVFLVVLVTSDWYSVYFRKTIRDEKLEPAMLRSSYAQTQDKDLRAVYLNALIRHELDEAESALRYKQYVRCEEALNAAQKDLGEQVDLDFAPHRLWLDRLLAISIKLRSAQGDKAGAGALSAMKTDLEDPAKAQRIFTAKNLRGFETSYPADFRQGYTYMLLTKEPEAKAFEIWWRELRQFPPHSKEQAESLFRLRVPSLASRDPDKIFALRSQLIDAAAKDLLIHGESQTEIDYFMQDRMFARDWPPLSTAKAKETLAQTSKESAICEAQHLDDTALRIARAEAYVTLGEFGKARGLLVPVLARPGKLTNNMILQEQTAGAIIRYCNEVGRAGGDVSKRLIIPLLSDALTVKEITKVARANLLLRLAHEYRAHGDKVKSRELVSLAWNEGKGAYNFDETVFEFDQLKENIEDLEFDKGEALYASTLQKHRENPDKLGFMTRQLLSYWRSIPNIALPSGKTLASNKFPERAYLDALRFTKPDSDEYRRCQLWLAQYYDCKHDTKKAIEYLENALSDMDETRFSAYFAADDLLAQLKGETPPSYLPAELTHAKPGNIVEMECQISLYKQLRRDLAARRLEALKARVREQ